MSLRRVWICAALLAVAAVCLELHFGARLARFEQDGGVVPPFGRPPAEQRAAIEARLADLAERDPHVVIGGFHPTYGWANFGGVHREGDATYRINGMGARGPREIASASPPAGRRRVLCFGDSFTYGSEVADGEDWPALLEGSGEGLEVWNFGVGGWGMDQALLCFREVGADLSPDVVLVGMFLGSIARNVNRYRPLLYPHDTNPVVKPRYTLAGNELRLLPVPYATRRELFEAFLDDRVLADTAEHEYWAGDDPAVPFSNLSRFLAASRAARRRDVAWLWRRSDLEPFRLTLALLQAFQVDARAAGAGELAVVLFPRKEDLWVYREEAWERNAYWAPLRAELERRGIPYLDTYPLLRRASHGGPVYLQQHLSPHGNRAVAEHVAAWLRERGVTPR